MSKKRISRIHPISVRPKTQEIRDLYIAKGGARWLNLLLEVELLEKKAAAVKRETSTTKG